MSNKLEWVNRNLSLGGLVRHAGNATGIIGNLGVQGVGLALSAVVDDPDAKTKIRSGSRRIGGAVQGGLGAVGTVAGKAVNHTVQAAGNLTGEAAAALAGAAGASPEGVATARGVGKLAGSAGIGLVAGLGVADVAVSLAAASGTVGAAATTSGLAALGGGSIASGGGGMAAGLAVTHTIVGGSALSGLASQVKGGD